MLLESLIEKATQMSSKTVAVAAAEDADVIEAILEAAERNLARFLLFGNQEKISLLLGSTVGKIKVIHADDRKAAVEMAVQAVSNREADVLMKGNVPTKTLLSAILNKEYGLRTGRVLSQAAVFELSAVNRLILITDAAMNITPSLEQKVQIVQNSVSIAKAIGINEPKVAPLAAVEVVNPAMQATTDAALLTMMNKRGQITDCIIDGPLALDNAVSAFAAQHKGIHSEVAGHADILLVPTIEVGNVLYKSLVYFANAKVASVIAGAKVPIVLTSRTDSAENKLYSLALALCCAGNC
ncbi:phosphate butyryltransferase [Bacillus rubiinfantis]|uniref:phosphate butyryltransferase n=1 Tax=Bacillus rubiinfantis TaxID=1499680 RepID=UPI0005A80A50|nr:phosphate butyryltransferase [Bacillus rubiinfantis]